VHNFAAKLVAKDDELTRASILIRHSLTKTAQCNSITQNSIQNIESKDEWVKQKEPYRSFAYDENERCSGK